jgi:hypothetical protein
VNNTKKKNDWFFTTHTFFCERQIPRLKVLQIFLTKDEVKKWRRRKYEFSSSLFPVLLLFLKLAKLSKEKKWNNHTHGLELTWNLKWGRLAKLDKFGGAPFQWRRQWWEKCHATKNRAEGRCVYRWVRGGAKLSWTQLNHGWRSSHFILQYFFGWCIGGRWVMYSSAQL